MLGERSDGPCRVMFSLLKSLSCAARATKILLSNYTHAFPSMPAASDPTFDSAAADQQRSPSPVVGGNNDPPRIATSDASRKGREFLRCCCCRRIFLSSHNMVFSSTRADRVIPYRGYVGSERVSRGDAASCSLQPSVTRTRVVFISTLLYA